MSVTTITKLDPATITRRTYDDAQSAARSETVWINGTYTATTTGAQSILSTITAPMRSYALQVKGTGATATSWNVVLEGSLDGVNFTAVLTHASGTNADGVTVFSGANTSPTFYFRARVTALTLGSATNIVVNILGTQ